jgi:aspartyl protease family protein
MTLTRTGFAMTGLLTKTAGMAGLLVVVAFACTSDLARRMTTSRGGDGSGQSAQAAAPAGRGGSAAAGNAAAPGPVSLYATGGGHFSATPAINGTRLSMMVDTGASVVVLSEEDATLAGIRPRPAEFTAMMSTANGMTLGAPVLLREVRLDDIVVRDVRAVVLQRGKLSGSLLGMTFLSRLSGFEISKDRLLLKP